MGGSSSPGTRGPAQRRLAGAREDLPRTGSPPGRLVVTRTAG